MEGSFQKEREAFKCYTFREIVSVIVTGEYNWSTTPGAPVAVRGILPQTDGCDRCQ